MIRRAVALAFVASCGGQTSAPEIPPSSSDFTPPPASSVPYDPNIGTLADVSGGRARVGGWRFNDAPFFVWKQEGGPFPTSLDLSPLPCDAVDGGLNGFWTYGAELIVAPFRMMTTEVTNRAYAVCVDSGACVPPDIPVYNDSQQLIDWRRPSIANRPVFLNWALARTFCRHYGGDLPTAGEYARATVGDAETYAQAHILDLIVACVTGQSQDAIECKKLASVVTLADVASDPNDVGPFGHYDLYSNALEWVRGYFDHGSAPWCSTPLYEHDVPLMFPPADNTDTPVGFDAFTYFPQALPVPDPQAADPLLSVSAETAIHAPWSTARTGFATAPLGFRCAFPTQP